MAPESQPPTYLNGLRHFAPRFVLLLLIATIILIALLRSAGPYEGDPRGVLRMATRPSALPFFFAAVIATALALELGVQIVAWAKRRDRLVLGAGIACFVLGLISGLSAITPGIALSGLLAAIPGLAVGRFVLRNEKRRGEGHSLLNLAGLALSAANVLVVACQMIIDAIGR